MATGMDQSQYPRIPKELADHTDAPLLREINGIILKACNPYPNERHTSVEALARDLELIQAGRSVVFYEEFRKRSRAILMVTASLALLAGLAALLFVWRTEVLQRANSQSQRALYKSDISNAKLAIATGELGIARAALLRQKPREGEEDLRGFEWAILAHAVRGQGAPLEPIPDPVAISKITVDATGRWVAASFIDDRVGVWDLRNGRIARVINNAQVLGGFRPDGRIVVDEPDRRVRLEKPNENAPIWVETNRRLRQLLPDGGLCVISPTGDLVYQIIQPESNSILSEINVSSLFPGTELSDSEVTSDGKTLLWAGYKEIGAIRERFLLAFDMPSRRLLWRIDPPRRIIWVRCSPDLKHAAINTGGLVPTIIDISDPNRQTFLEGHSSRVQEAIFSPSGDLIATGSADQTVRVWNVQDGTLTSTHRGMGRPCTAIAWLPSNDHLVVGDDSGEIQVFGFPPTVSQNALTGMYSDIHGDLVFDKTGQRAAITQSPNTIAIASTVELAQIDTVTNVFQPIRFSTDGSSLLAFSNDWSVVSVDLQTKRQTFYGNLVPKEFSVDSWAISKNQDRLAMTADGGHLAILNLNEMTCVRIENTNILRIWGVTFSPDGEQIWTGAEDGTIQIRASSDGHIIRQETKLPDGDIQAMALSADEKWLAVSLFNDASVRVWDRTHKIWLEPWFAHRRFVQALLFTRDSSRLISGGVDGRVVFWRIPDFEEIASFEVAPLPKPTGDEGIATLRLTSEEEILGALTEDGRFHIWRGQ
jgi:WD40 repeat protein